MNELPRHAPTMGTEHAADTRRFILVGADCKTSCTCTPWAKLHEYNLVDFDVVILIGRTFSSGASSLDHQTLNIIAQQINRMLSSGGELVVVIRPNPKIPVRNVSSATKVSPFGFTQLFPVNFALREEKGETIERREKSRFDKYLRNLTSWNFWIHPTNKASVLEFLINREGRALAGTVSEGPFHVTMLPDIAGFGADEIGRAMLAAYGLVTEDVPEPEWTDRIDVPGLRTVASEIQTLEAQIEQAKGRAAELETDRRHLVKYRKLLYSKGDDLELIVSEVLTQLGAKLLVEKYSDEDLLIQIGDQVCVVEVTGSEGPLKLQKLRQLFNHAFDVEEKTGNRPKGILIANPLRLLPPDARSGAEMPEFPDNVTKRAAEMKLALISGRWLFDKFCEFREGKAEAGAILQSIVIADGAIQEV